MELTLQREPSTAKSTPGKLSVDGAFYCFTLEDVVRERRNPDGSLVPVAEWKVDGSTAIPSGTYDAILDFSEHFQRVMPHIMNVPDFTEVRIHYGNWSFNSTACVLVGLVRQSPDEILESRAAFEPLLAKMQAAVTAGEKISIAVLNPPAPSEDAGKKAPSPFWKEAQAKVGMELQGRRSGANPFWEMLETHIATELHHPNPRFKEMDGLLEKLMQNPPSLTVAERKQLKVLLAARAKDMHTDVTDEQRSSAALMPMLMDKVLAERVVSSKGEEKLRIPYWLGEAIAIGLVSLGTYFATHFHDNAVSEQRFNDQMTVSERDREQMHLDLDRRSAEVLLNSQSREAMKVQAEATRERLDEIKGLVQRDLAQQHSH